MKPGKKTLLPPGTMCMDPLMFVNNERIWEKIHLPGKWISIKEKEPEIDTKVFVRYLDGCEPYFSGAYIEKCSGIWWIDTIGSIEQSNITVTHWMEIPELPKEDNGKEKKDKGKSY